MTYATDEQFASEAAASVLPASAHLSIIIIIIINNILLRGIKVILPVGTDVTVAWSVCHTHALC